MKQTKLICTSPTWEAAPGAVDVSERLFLSDGPLDLLQDQVQLLGAPQVLLLRWVEALPQRQELPLVDINHISFRGETRRGGYILQFINSYHCVRLLFLFSGLSAWSSSAPPRPMIFIINDLYLDFLAIDKGRFVQEQWGSVCPWQD